MWYWENPEGGAVFMLPDKGYGPWLMKRPERWKNGNYPNNKQQCVALAQVPLRMPLTKWWREGWKVLGNSIGKGTVIATFIDGRYPNRPHGNHVAIYLDQGKDDQGRDFIEVIDQWSGQPPHYRKIWSGRVGRSNNADAFSVVFTLMLHPGSEKWDPIDL